MNHYLSIIDAEVEDGVVTGGGKVYINSVHQKQ